MSVFTDDKEVMDYLKTDTQWGPCVMQLLEGIEARDSTIQELQNRLKDATDRTERVIDMAQRAVTVIKEKDEMIRQLEETLGQYYEHMKERDPSMAEFEAALKVWLQKHAELENIEVRNGDEYPKSFLDKYVPLFEQEYYDITIN